MTVTINRQQVIDEVAKTTAYIGAKILDSDAKAYERLSTTEADTVMLERFWHESRDNICSELRRIISAECSAEDDNLFEFSIWASADYTLIPTIESGLFSYFVQYITGSWLALAGSDRADGYLTKAANTLCDLRRKILCRRMPVHPKVISNDIDESQKKIILYTEALLYDIEHICFMEALSMESKDEDSIVPHIIGDVCGDDNIDHVRRIVATVHAHAAELLYPLTKKKAVISIFDNLSSSPDSYDIVLCPDSSISDTALMSITNLLHLYIVYRTVGEWLSASNPTASVKWIDKSALIAAEIHTSVNSIASLPRRRRVSPF